MEYEKITENFATYAVAIFVLILVLMEYEKMSESGNGSRQHFVLILVLMEYEKISGEAKFIESHQSLNPCFNGIRKNTYEEYAFHRRYLS